jgi:hypothetical protein
MSTTSETIRELGRLEPHRRLVARTAHHDFPLGSFDVHADTPPAFADLLAKHGLGLDTSIDRPTLIASDTGVATHQDYQLTAVWVLIASDDADEHGPTLTVGDQTVRLFEGQVLLFDAWIPHRLDTRHQERWALLSTYVKQSRR